MEGGAPAFTQLLFPMHDRIDQAKRTSFDLGIATERASLFKRRSGRLDGQRTSRGIHPGCLEDVVGLADRERYTFDIVEGITTDIDLSAGGICQGHTIVADSRMLGSQAADRDGLESPNTSIILHGYARKAFDGFRQILYT